MRAYRLLKARYQAGALGGEGARLYGGRWNSKGQRVVYLAAHLSLAALEVLVHAGGQSALQDMVRLRLTFAEAQVEMFGPATLPPGWRDDNPPPFLQQYGDRWLAEGRSLLLAVPSAVVPEEMNYLLNPAHPEVGTLEISPAEPFDFDPRLFKN